MELPTNPPLEDLEPGQIWYVEAQHPHRGASVFKALILIGRNPHGKQRLVRTRLIIGLTSRKTMTALVKDLEILGERGWTGYYYWTPQIFRDRDGRDLQYRRYVQAVVMAGDLE